ncbi:MAG: toxin-antitoxin system HicB family antitoxin [Treponema sp.]|nr:toxin-antitoxin system HicB family antitoxin [Treponema sp.]MBR5645180.1 toxin-antitoxin system HicB family antitoxin [Treponema sp.]
MSSLSLRLPDSYHTAVKEIAVQDNISINQFIVSAVAEKIAAFETQHYLENRAQQASKDKFNAVLAKVPSTEPADYDK